MIIKYFISLRTIGHERIAFFFHSLHCANCVEKFRTSANGNLLWQFWKRTFEHKKFVFGSVAQIDYIKFSDRIRCHLYFHMTCFNEQHPKSNQLSDYLKWIKLNEQPIKLVSLKKSTMVGSSNFGQRYSFGIQNYLQWVNQTFRIAVS